MDKTTLLHFIRQAAREVPAVYPRLSPRARLAIAEPTEYKTYEFFLSAIQGLVNGVYQGLIGGVFIDTLANLISGQLTDAYTRAWVDDGNFGDLPPYLAESLEAMILDQYNYVDQFFKDIIDARIDQTPIAPLLARAQVWANQYNSAYNEAVRLIALENGGNLQWVYGDTDHCDTCERLNGIVARAKEWETLSVHPQQPENILLSCGGWRCQCALVPTDKRRSPNAMTTIMNIVNKI